MLDEAEFEVGDLTIICGENNTGKTYATYSLYGYLDFMRTIMDNMFLGLSVDYFVRIAYIEILMRNKKSPCLIMRFMRSYKVI